MPSPIFILFIYFLRQSFALVTQAGLKHLDSSSSPASASQRAGITGVCHHAQHREFLDGNHAVAAVEDEGAEVDGEALAGRILGYVREIKGFVFEVCPPPKGTKAAPLQTGI